MSTVVKRWVFTDLASGDSMTLGINPESMVSAYNDRTLSGTPNAQGTRMYVWEAPGGLMDWSFSGTILTRVQLVNYLTWVKGRKTLAQVEDHLGSLYTGYFKGLSLTPAKSQLYPYRHAVETRMSLTKDPTVPTVADSRRGLAWVA